MQIKDLFQRKISRAINGVVKADELDASSVWQELDEFVVTRELDKHFRKFFSSYVKAIQHPDTSASADRNGVWISGFFGSGKSHFIKVLSYLLANAEHTHEENAKHAIEFFEEKVTDATLLADIKTAVAAPTDVILFNIDSKADHRKGRDAILQVFLKVLNEQQGYSPDHPHIAHMERYLAGKGKLASFHEAFHAAIGAEWKQERDAYAFHRDEVIQALSATLGQSTESAAAWIDGAEEHFSLTVENFARWVREYLDQQGPKHRIIFLVDEVGQFIGTDTHLMLNLQTITEELGTICRGRAWIVVTSQEDIDAVLGEISGSKANDFSKIQGRFRTRLSLSSSNVDEVIQYRLLDKKEEAKGVLEATFADKGDILKHQLTFTNCGMTLKPYRSAEEFVKDYPFAPYQFQLIQKIFEAIRKVGATGLHLSRGERSMLDAFHSAAQQLAHNEVGILVPLYRFYPSIESFLDTAVKKTIDQAADNPSLVTPADQQLLQTLFLIRYVEEMKGNVDNLVTLFMEQIDADRMEIRRRIEESLLRLEKETLIARNGDVYFFLTNEERDISREIKNVELSSQEEARRLGELIYEDVLAGQSKYRYPANRMDFSLTRLCDDFVYGKKLESGLTVGVISPLSDDYEIRDKSRCIPDSTMFGGQLLIRLDDNPMLGLELRGYLQTEKYLRTRNDGTLPESTRRIHRDLAELNRGRRDRLITLLKEMMAGADYFAAGQPLSVKATSPLAALDEGLEYLVRNSFSKMGYIRRLAPDPEKEIQAVLRANDIAQQTLALKTDEANPEAIDDLRRHIDLSGKASHTVVLRDLVETRYANRPYGWPEGEVLLLVARLLVLNQIRLVIDGEPVPPAKAYEILTTPAKQRRATLLLNQTSDPKAVQSARALGKEVFSEMGPEAEEALVPFLRRHLESWYGSLETYRSLAETGNYPGLTLSSDGVTLIRPILAATENRAFIERFTDRKEDLLEFAESFREIQYFHQHQKTAWDRLRTEYKRFQLNLLQLEHDQQASRALRRMEEILAAPAPYSLLRESDDLIATADAVNRRLVELRRAGAVAAIERHAARLQAELDDIGAGESLRTSALRPLGALLALVNTQESLAHIAQAETEALNCYDAALERIERHMPTADPAPGISEPGAGMTLKPRCVVRPADLLRQSYLETIDDVNGFLDTMRRQLEEALSRGERIEIR